VIFSYPRSFGGIWQGWLKHLAGKNLNPSRWKHPFEKGINFRFFNAFSCVFLQENTSKRQEKEGCYFETK
jgi:hypothetical protein